MVMKKAVVLAALVSSFFLGACATAGSDKDPYAKSGFYTHVHDNRLWVLKEGDKDIDLVSKNKEPKVVVTRIAAGPKNITVKSNDAAVIDAYLAR
jgi:hypothetical protein